ncbi:T6SS phospholipase effector Tle1-like catalytic domain-containing protein [Halarcobacter anaerophilus]|uniref:T6SS Phospholipase effector Tle1-like catalytic domain-containing protein n=1 Tax=Halarcobacter anaerophilus TaxID=877500 RepID=A0A4Q0XXN9_9BACT|nr:DUF2235 domain-containing protein [Halarcobacter anaerophilus]QDF28494.1 alpha/beta hydrolase domain-containing (DUF2235) protein [Halarcobacter anaerophilus]RXJ61059.1 hypothetical protein CRV06_14815 [Halarcobacter anaerophilus]
MSNDITIGRAYFKEDEGLHLNEFCSKEDEKALREDRKVRIAYMIISDKESKEINQNEENKEKILEKVKDHYQKYLVKAVEQESLKNDIALTYTQLKDRVEEIVDKKLVFLSMYSLFSTKSYEYSHAHDKKLESNLKEKKEDISTTSLIYSFDSSQKLLCFKNEKIEQKEEIGQAYIILSMPYVYNIKKNSINKELELTYYEDNVIASYMPELIVEYGVFFDGTNNNIYNIDFYRNFTDFLKKPTQFILDNKDKRAFEIEKPIEDITKIEEYILSTPEPKVSDEVIVLLLSQMNNFKKPIRYFDDESNLSLDDKEVLKSSKAKHAKKVFNFLVDVKKSTKNIEEKDIADFVREDILLDDDEESSYVNGESNIARLHKLYDGDDVKNGIDSVATTRFKLYESGSGTHNPFVSKNYEGDSMWGLGLAIGETGVKAHIIYSCIKIAEQFEDASIYRIDELVFDIFGFSRGAATARHFVCSILKEADIVKCTRREYTISMKDDKDIFYPFFGDKGYVNIAGKLFFNPLRVDIKTGVLGERDIPNPYYKNKKIKIDTVSFRFVGLYDTVSHYGLSQGNDSEDLNLDFYLGENHEKVGQVVHLMADDEYRFNFDAYSIFPTINNSFRKHDKKLQKGGYKFEEYYIPGAHADIGGGYNESSETVLISKEILDKSTISQKLKNKILVWNKKYNWLNTNQLDIIEKHTKNEIKDLEEDGIYFISRSLPNNSKYALFIYLHKANVSNKYEYVALKLMHNRAIYQDVTEALVDKKDINPFERVPLGKLTSYIFKDNKNILNKTYGILEQNKEMKVFDSNTYKELKAQFLHHSSKNDSFVNRASNEEKDNNDFYGRRVIYSATGTKFTRV